VRNTREAAADHDRTRESSDARLAHGTTLRKSPSYYQSSSGERVRSHGRLTKARTHVLFNFTVRQQRSESEASSIPFTLSKRQEVRHRALAAFRLIWRRGDPWACPSSNCRNGFFSGAVTARILAVPLAPYRQCHPDQAMRSAIGERTGRKSSGLLQQALARHNGSVHVRRLIARGYTASAGSKLCT
jgi:hypothetical protein